MNGHLLRGFLAVMMLCVGLSSNAHAQSAFIEIDHTGYPQCQRGPGFYTLNISIRAVSPVATARFKVVPSSPVLYMNPADGVFDLSFSPACVGSGSTLGTFSVLVPNGSTVTFSVVPLTGHSEIEVLDCDGIALPTVSGCYYYHLLGPYRPNPPDGALNVPTDQLLSYVGDANFVAMSTNPNFNVWDPSNVRVCNHEGTDTTPPPCPLPVNPGTLAPHTTYYWQAVYRCICGQVSDGYSEVFSFTTGDAALAVEPATWGRVKAMYRD